MEASNTAKTIAIAACIASAAAIVTISILTHYWFQADLPPLPEVRGGVANADSVKQTLDNYKALSAIAKDNNSYLYTLLVDKFLEDLFSSLLVAVIAYVFGRPLLYAFANVVSRGKGSRE